MTHWYNKPKSGKIGSISPDYEGLSIKFDQGVFRKCETHIQLTCKLLICADLKGGKEDGFKAVELPQLVTIPIPCVDKHGKAEVPLASKLVYEHVSEKYLEGVWSGSIALNIPEQQAQTLRDKAFNGVPLPPEQLAMLWTYAVNLVPDQLRDYVEADIPALKPLSSGGWSGGSKGQTEAERLADRQAFLSSLLASPDAFQESYGRYVAMEMAAGSPDSQKPSLFQFLSLLMCS